MDENIYVDSEQLDTAKEQSIRNFLNELTYEERVDSVYLIDIDFSTAPMDDIISSITGLYNEVKSLKNMVDNDFKSITGEKVLMPTDPQVQGIIIQDYNRKGFALSKVLLQPDIKELVSKKLYEERKKSSREK